MQKTFTHTKRIYVDETDYGGIVYHANHLKFMEHARSEWLFDNNITNESLAKEGVHFIVASVNINYLKPIPLNKIIGITCQIDKISRASLVANQPIHCAEDKNCIYSKSTVKLVCINNDMRPIRIPQHIVEKLT